MEHFTLKLGTKAATLHAYMIGLDQQEETKQPPRPAILIFPGGSYEFCSPWEDEPIALAYMSEGYHAFTLHYSVSKDQKVQVFPQVLEEAEAALKKIRENAAEWNVDPNRIAVIGFSAGGHLAAYVSSAGKEKPNATILGYPRIFGSSSDEERFIPDAVESVDRNTPPAFIFTTREDEAVSPKHAMKYATALQDYHIPYEMHIFEKGMHGMSLGKSWSANAYDNNRNPAFARWFQMSISWLKLHFGDFEVRTPENYIVTKSKSMEMPMAYLLEDEKLKAILFETVPAMIPIVQTYQENIADMTISRLSRISMIMPFLTKVVMEELDYKFVAEETRKC